MNEVAVVRLDPVRVIDDGDDRAGRTDPSRGLHNPDIATGMILAIFVTELQECLFALTNAKSFPG